MKTILFGAGKFGHLYCEKCSDQVSILAIADNNAALWENKTVFGHKVISPDKIKHYDYDRITITLDDYNDGISKILDIVSQLNHLGIDPEKIVLQDLKYPTDEPRVRFLDHFSKIIDATNFAVAECGVFRGEFAAHINRCFPNNKLYLFDAFEGFRESDVAEETSLESLAWLERGSRESLNLGANELPALLRCPYKKNVVLRKGFVPDTFENMPEEKYGFVNLDMDLFAPTLHALCYFANRMEDSGVILLHDYFCEELPGIKRAVDEFRLGYSFHSMPIGDEYSLAIVGIKRR